MFCFLRQRNAALTPDFYIIEIQLIKFIGYTERELRRYTLSYKYLYVRGVIGEAFWCQKEEKKRVTAIIRFFHGSSKLFNVVLKLENLKKAGYFLEVINYFFEGGE